MEFPRYWIKLRQVLDSRDIPQVEAWGWSDSSAQQAAELAQRRLDQGVAAARAGSLPPRSAGWYYPRVPLREHILGAAGRHGLVTRNRYGAVVLNSPTLFIADIDLPEETAQGRAGGDRPSLLRRIFGGPRPVEPEAQDAAVAAPEPEVEKALDPVRSYAAQNPSLGVRVYRTSAGLRVIVTGLDLPANSPQARSLLEQFGSDPLYVELAAAYDSYRARLSPKPWRCGVAAVTGRWIAPGTVVDHHAFAPTAEWVAAYDAASARYAVCRIVEVHGAAPSPDEREVIEIHDRACGVDRTLPLA